MIFALAQFALYLYQFPNVAGRAIFSNFAGQVTFPNVACPAWAPQHLVDVKLSLFPNIAGQAMIPNVAGQATFPYVACQAHSRAEVKLS